MRLQQTKRASRATGGPQYYFHDLSEPVKLYLRGKGVVAAVPQVGDPIWSMHKKKNKESVLAGEMILTFHKTGARRRYERKDGFDLAETINKVLWGLDANIVYGEYLFNRVILEAWNKGAIGSLTITKDEFTHMKVWVGIMTRSAISGPKGMRRKTRFLTFRIAR